MFDKIEKAEVTDSGFDDPEMEMYSCGYVDGISDGEEWGNNMIDAIESALTNPNAHHHMDRIEAAMLVINTIKSFR